MPSRLGRYVVLRRIGAGGFATVWLAYDEQLDSPVAVKVLADNWSGDDHVRGRFVEEGRFLRKVESPHVVSVYDAGELEDGRPYLVMSYADQGTLADRLELQSLTAGQSLEVISQVGLGLRALHLRGVLHRDIKPANVLFRTIEDSGSDRFEMRAMVADLGLGKALDMSSRLTMIAGTPTFVAPEQAQGEPLDARADQYSLAVLTFLLLTGRAPYAHATLGAAAAPGPPPALRGPERGDGSLPDRAWTPGVDQVVRRALSPDRERRWPDVMSYVSALEEALADHRDSAPPARLLPLDPQLTQPGARPAPSPVSEPLGQPSLPRSRRRKVLLAVLGLVALAAGVVGGFAVERLLRQDVTVMDDTGSISVTVPYEWNRAVATDEWLPPNDTQTFPALSVGTSETWADEGATGEQGVFVGILAGQDLPLNLPRHPECEVSTAEVVNEGDSERSKTRVYTGCSTGVTVERVVQVASNRLMWVQVRSQERATANAVLDSLDLSGF